MHIIIKLQTARSYNKPADTYAIDKVIPISQININTAIPPYDVKGNAIPVLGNTLT